MSATCVQGQCCLVQVQPDCIIGAITSCLQKCCPGQEEADLRKKKNTERGPNWCPNLGPVSGQHFQSCPYESYYDARKSDPKHGPFLGPVLGQERFRWFFLRVSDTRTDGPCVVLRLVAEGCGQEFCAT
jgi:hypothetical protein